MVELGESMSALSPATVAALGVLVLAQLALQALALIDIVRRPETTVLGGRKWVWIVVVLLGEVLGAIAYFAFGRKPRPVEERHAEVLGESVSSDARVAAAADVLYGHAEPPDEDGSGTP